MSPESPFRFVWDRSKAAENARKHRIRFEEATLVFLDPLHQIELDARHEDRWRTYGIVGGELLVVTHTDVEHMVDGWPVTEIRIISARFATPSEERDYHDNPR